MARSKLAVLLLSVGMAAAAQRFQHHQHLENQPMLASRKRKVLRPNPIAPWELKLGDIRVFYEVMQTPAPLVTIKAIGVKENNELFIGGERVVI